MPKLISFLTYLKLLLLSRPPGQPPMRGYPEFLMKYSDRWFVLVSMVCFFFIFLLATMLILDFTSELDSTLQTIEVKVVGYLLIAIPSMVILMVRQYLRRKQRLDSRAFTLANSLISVVLTSLALTHMLLMIYAESLEGNAERENTAEMYDITVVTGCAYFIIWVLTQVTLLKSLLLFIHNLIILFFFLFVVKVGTLTLLRTLLSLLAVSAIMLYYSGYRENEILDSFKSKQNSEKIQEDWKNIIDDFPNGLALISLKKKVLFLNRTIIELLDLKTELTDSLDGRPMRPDKNGNYLSLVEKIGKIEEVFPYKESFADIINNTNPKRKFSIQESPLHNNIDKKLGYSPVNISSQSFSYIRGFSNPHILFTSNEIQATEKRRLSTGLDPKASCLGKGDEILTRKGGLKIEMSPESNLNLDLVINQMRKRLLNGKPNATRSDQSNYRTFCTQFKNCSTLSKANNRKFEVKIKPVIYKVELVLMIVIQDVSFMELVQELRENNDYKNKVLTTLSHELRTPLNGAITPIEKLLNDETVKGVDSTIATRLGIAFKSLLLLQSVLNDVVDFALINSNQLYLNYEELVFHRFLKETLDLFQSQAEEKGLTLELLFDNQRKITRDFRTDYQRLRQILVSLLNNSLKNTFTGNIQLEVSLEEDTLERTMTEKSRKTNKEKEADPFPERIENDEITQYTIRLTIRDTGVGIEAARLQNIRKSLSSDDLLVVCTNLNRRNGCGLGLIISQCLSLLLGPSNTKGLEIKSTEGSGTEISFLLAGFIERTSIMQSSRSVSSLSIIEEKKHESSNIGHTFTISSKNNSFSCDLIRRKRNTFMHSDSSQPGFGSEEGFKLPSAPKKCKSLMVHKKLSEELENNEDSEIDERILNFMTQHSFATHTDHLVIRNSEGGTDYRVMRNSLGSGGTENPMQRTINSQSQGSFKNFSRIGAGIQSGSLEGSEIPSSLARRTCFCTEILIVDDDSFNILALESLLNKWNFKILKAFNGLQAVEIIKDKLTRKCCDRCGGVQIIFLDYHMPIMNGVEAAREIRGLVGQKNIPPIIGCTAFGARDLVDDWRAAGMNDFMVKPIDSQKIERILKKWRVVN